MRKSARSFKASGVGTIAGSYVLDGVFERGCSGTDRAGMELSRYSRDHLLL